MYGEQDRCLIGVVMVNTRLQPAAMWLSLRHTNELIIFCVFDLYKCQVVKESGRVSTICLMYATISWQGLVTFVARPKFTHNI